MNAETFALGVVGAVALLPGPSAPPLPVVVAGLALLLLGLALVAAEAIVAPSGLLGLGGVVAFVLGAMLLVDTEAPEWQVSLPLVAGVALASAAVALVVVRAALRARRQRPQSGAQAMVGAPARVLDWDGGDGHVLVHGERWHAVGDAALAPGEPVRVTRVDGLTVRVARERPA